MHYYHILTYPRFQWINHPYVVALLSRFLKPPKRGRKGYNKVLMFRWLMYKQLMQCSYRDLEGVSGIDYSTFIKFRKRLITQRWLPYVSRILSRTFAQLLPSITGILDSSFVETYSKHDEQGSAYSGYKKKNGFKTHQIIDFKTRLPLIQTATHGARADIKEGERLVERAPPSWNVDGFLADKAYDGWEFVSDIKQKWKGVRVGIPVRRTLHEQNPPFPPEVMGNRTAKEADRYLKKRFLNKRTEIERYFSRKKRVFHLGEERTRHLKNFRANCSFTSVMEILEWSTTPA